MAASPPKNVWGKGPPAAAIPPAAPPASSPAKDATSHADTKDAGASGAASAPPPPPVNAWAKGAPNKAKAAASPEAASPAPAAASAEAEAAAPPVPPVKKSWADMAKTNQPPPQPKAADAAASQGGGDGEAKGEEGKRQPPAQPQQVVKPSQGGAGGAAPPSKPHAAAHAPAQPVAERGAGVAEDVDKEQEAARQMFERMIDGAMGGAIIERRVRGLQNPGNMCFVNAVVQCLSACRPLFRFIAGARDHPIPEQMGTMQELSALFGEMMDEFVELGEGAKESKRGVGAHKGAIRGSAMASVVNRFVPEDPVRPMGGKGRQEDAQEFLGFVLNALHDELATGEAPVGGGGGEGEGGGNVQEEVVEEEEDNDGWLQVGGKGGAKKTSVRKMRTERTLVTAVFGGEVETMIRYSGTWASAVREPWMWLSLDIRPSEVKDLNDALNHFLQPEKLSMQDDKKASKHVRVTLWPEVLVIHLKRFHFDDQGGQKVNKKIAYPELFPVHAEGSGSKASTSGVMRNYALSSVVLHHGKKLTEGHYTAMVRQESERGDSWVKVDDESTSSVTQDEVLAQQQLAYLLFYKHVRLPNP